MQKLLQELKNQQELKLQGERERVRMDSERRLLDERMQEVSQAFHNAETDEVKILKQKLRREKSKRKRTKERNKSLLKVKSITNRQFCLMFFLNLNLSTVSKSSVDVTVDILIANVLDRITGRCSSCYN